jgi:AcrR family transcriptional regulator
VPSSPRPVTLREEQKLATSRRIVRAAQRVFVHSGYSKASIDEIAAEAGVSRATLYLHFDSKADLMAAASKDLQNDSDEMFRRLLVVLADGSRQDLRDWLCAALGWLDARRPMARASQESQLEEPEKAASSIRTSVLQILEPWVQQWPPARRAEARVRLELCRLQLQHFVWGHYRQLVMVGDEVVIDVLTDFWWGTLREPLAAAT